MGVVRTKGRKHRERLKPRQQAIVRRQQQARRKAAKGGTPTPPGMA